VNVNIIQSFAQKKVLLVGDVILDVYIQGKSAGQALGVSVPRIEEVHTSVAFGGNGLVANNILELGGILYFVSIVGADGDAKLYNSLRHKRLHKFFFTDKSRRTTVKKRLFVDGKRLLHLNSADNHTIDGKLENKIIAQVESLVDKVDVVVIMDPQHGLLTRKLIKKLLDLSKKFQKPLYIDAQIAHRKSNHHLYAGAHTMLLNENEAKAVYPSFNPLEPEKSIKRIQQKLHLQNVIVKLGENGSIALISDTFIKTAPRRVDAVDPVGAGDAFLAAVCLGDRNNPKDTLEVANIWAALSTTIPGTTPPKKKALLTIV
jgi:rfaE bifunctional protein kinase chain/domain